MLGEFFIFLLIFFVITLLGYFPYRITPPHRKKILRRLYWGFGALGLLYLLSIPFCIDLQRGRVWYQALEVPSIDLALLFVPPAIYWLHRRLPKNWRHRHPSMTIILYVVDALLVLIFCCLALLHLGIGSIEEPHPYFPYINTELPENFSKAAFAQIKPGMTQDAVQALAGQPLSISNHRRNGECWKVYPLYPLEEREGYTHACNDQDSEYWHYGRENKVLVYYGWVRPVVKLDSQGRVVRTFTFVTGTGRHD